MRGSDFAQVVNPNEPTNGHLALTGTEGCVHLRMSRMLRRRYVDRFVLHLQCVSGAARDTVQLTLIQLPSHSHV